MLICSNILYYTLMEGIQFNTFITITYVATSTQLHHGTLGNYLLYITTSERLS